MAPSRDDILKQITGLQAQITNTDVPQNFSLLAPATPSPRKKRRIEKPLEPFAHPKKEPFVKTTFTEPSSSTLLSRLAALRSNSAYGEEIDNQISRTTSFSERPPEQCVSSSTAFMRDDRLALIEEFEPGPVEHQAPFDDPNFASLEPNSKIRLSLSHEDLQEHLRGRFYLSPSRLYSCIRMLPDKSAYDVPVPGDWITIAVVAERGPIRTTKAPVPIGRDDEFNPKWKGNGRMEQQSNKKFVKLTLIDFGSRSKSSATAGKAVIRGDALLSLLLFEADTFDVVKEIGKRDAKIYRGGSNGAFESLSKVREGDVIALLNPKVLRPFQSNSNQAPHPQTNILAVTPESAESIIVIGRSKDLGKCQAMKRDGKLCGSWCDKRVNDVCEYHVQHAVQRTKAGRAEFSMGTSGLGRSAAVKKNGVFDPTRKFGMLPQDDSGATYIVSGHIIKGSNDQDPLFVAENVGREGQAKAQRKQHAKETERTLKMLLDRDNEGMKAVIAARTALDSKYKRERSISGDTEGLPETSSEGKKKSKREHSFSAEVIKKLGFDPIAAKTGSRQVSDTALKSKMATLAALQSSRKAGTLSARPGDKIRSGVSAPETRGSDVAKDEKPPVDLDSD